MKAVSEAAQKHQLWLDWRKRTVEENFLDVCTCYIGKPFMKAVKPCKLCEVCVGCEQHIKKTLWRAHTRVCRALNELMSGATVGHPAAEGNRDDKSIDERAPREEISR